MKLIYILYTSLIIFHYLATIIVRLFARGSTHRAVRCSIYMNTLCHVAFVSNDDYRRVSVEVNPPVPWAQKESAPWKRQGRVALGVEYLGIDRLASPRQTARACIICSSRLAHPGVPLTTDYGIDRISQSAASISLLRWLLPVIVRAAG